MICDIIKKFERVISAGSFINLIPCFRGNLRFGKFFHLPVIYFYKVFSRTVVSIVEFKLLLALVIRHKFRQEPVEIISAVTSRPNYRNDIRIRILAYHIIAKSVKFGIGCGKSVVGSSILPVRTCRSVVLIARELIRPRITRLARRAVFSKIELFRFK